MVLDFILNYELWNNTGLDYLIAITILAVVTIFLKLFDVFLVKILEKVSKKTKNNLDDLIVEFLSGIKWPFFIFMGIYLSLQTLVLPELIHKALKYLLVIFIAFYSAKGLIYIINYYVKKEVNKRENKGDPESTSMIKVFGTILKTAIWSVALLMVLGNLGIEITPLIAGLGIGGIAIAIALQSVLGDVFSAFAIYFDKPFKDGDFIIIGDDMGMIKHIGIKSTRIQTLQGQELIVSNSELTNTRINNYKKMEKRRVVFGFGVEYSTPSRKLKKINEIVKNVMEKVKDADLDRVHFKDFGDFSLNYEVVYYINSPDYNKYMDTQEEINLKIKEDFEKEKIVFAFPTQTIFIAKD